MIFQGIRTNSAKKPYIFVIFQGGPEPCPHSESAHGMVYHFGPFVPPVLDISNLKGNSFTCKIDFSDLVYDVEIINGQNIRF